MKKVLHIIWGAQMGGISKVVLQLAKQQKASSAFSPSIFICRTDGILREFFSSGIPIVLGNFKPNVDVSPVKLYRALKSFREYDILHFHTFNPLIAFTALLSSKKIVYTIHGTPSHERYQNKIKESLLKIFLNNFVSVVTFNSEFTRKQAMNIYGLRKVKTATILNGIELNSQPTTHNSEPDIQSKLSNSFVVTCISRFAKAKRIGLLVDAFSKFSINKNTKLLLIGDGPPRKEIEEQIRQLNISDKTIITGFVDNPSIYATVTNIYVFPSASEPFGLVAVEALAAGKPAIIMNDGGGLVEIISPICVDDIVDDVDGIVRRLEHYFSNLDDGKSEAKRKEYANNFSIGAMQKAMDGIYQGLVSQNRQGQKKD